ncbi:IS701 family transposase [Nocardia sp. NBC_00403]|uniref:IS701 family transposase n=1 Tax=Nocardia sp. NBC_00403 TaxID=2975990 RepID=UPI002E1BA220
MESTDPGHELITLVAGRFGRVETRTTARNMLAGLVSELPTKNCWTLAERTGDQAPNTMQNLLAQAVWDEDAVRDDLRRYVLSRLVGGLRILVVDETGDVKKSTKTVGVQRQYTGTAGRIENSQVAVYLTYTCGAGHAFLDGELYLPKSWTDDPARLAEAGVPNDVAFATKPALVSTMITRALDGGVDADWATGDEVAGADPKLRRTLEQRGIGYVLAIGCDRRMVTDIATTRRRRGRTGPAQCVATTVGRYRRERPTPIRLGVGADLRRRHPKQPPGQRWLLIRRHPRTLELATAATHPGRCRWSPWSTSPYADGPHRGKLPDRQKSRRFGPAAGPPLEIMAAPDHPRDARPCLPHRARYPHTNPNHHQPS